MLKKCFFCDVQTQDDDKIIIKNECFFARFDDFPITEGHCEIISKRHLGSFFDLTFEEITQMYDLIVRMKEVIDKKYNPDAYNIGVNDGKAAGRSVHHLHIHLIPRYFGDVKDPTGGVRNIIPKKADFIPEIEKMHSKKDYL